MKAKIILTTPRDEILVATFTTQNEAFICASLLQAKVNSEEFVYRVQFKEKGILYNRLPGSLVQTLGTLANNQLEKIAGLF
jgi:hypothetical protein